MSTKISFSRSILAIGVAGALASSAAMGGSINALTAQSIAVQTTDTILQNQPTNANLVFTAAAAIPVNSTITLKANGAKFNPSTPPTLTAAGGTFAVASATGTLNGDNTQAQWTVTGAGAATDTATFNLNTVQSTDLRGVATGTNVTYTTTINSGGAAIDSTPLTSATAFTLVNAASAATTAATDTADVAQSYVFITPGTGTVAGAAATFTVTNNTTAQAIQTTNLVCTMRGDFNGVTTVAGANLTGSTEAGVTGGGVANQFLINGTKDAASAVLTASLAGGASVAVAPSLTYDGTTAQVARAFAVECDMLAAGSFVAADNMIAPANVINVVRNGFGFQTVFTGTTANNQIIIRDNSNALGAAGGSINVTATVYDANGVGTTIGPVKLAAKLPNNGQVTLDPTALSNEISTLSGTTIPAGVFATFNFAVETSSGTAGVKKQVSGVGIDIKETTNSGVPAI